MRRHDIILEHINTYTVRLEKKQDSASLQYLSRSYMIDNLQIPTRSLDRNLRQLMLEGKVKSKKVGTALYFFSQKPIERVEFGLDAEELEALCLAEKFLAPYANTPLDKHFKNAIKKIRLAAKETTQIDENLDNKYSVAHIPHLAFMGEDVFKKIQEAYNARRIIKVDYYTFRQQKDKAFKAEQHELEPSQFVYKDSRWYLLAFNISAETFSLYALSRVKKVEIENRTYKLRLKQMKMFINKLKQQEQLEVVCSISQNILPYIYEMNQFPNGHPYLRDEWKEKLTSNMLTAQLKGNIKYKITFNQYEWETLAYKYSFQKWALGWGQDITVQGPKEYVQKILSNIEKMRKQYLARLAEIESSEKEYLALQIAYNKEPQQVINEWNDKLNLQSEDHKQLVAEKMHYLISGEYKPDKGSFMEVLTYYLKLEYRKDFKTKALPDRYL